MYDAFNRRISKTVDGNSIFYIHDGDQIIEERDASGNLNATFLYGNGIDEILAMFRGGNLYAYHHDALGSVDAIVDWAGNPAEFTLYDVYGNPSTTNSSIGNPFLFTGRQYDPETGLYYYRNRMYDPTLGRFLQHDPIGYADSMNLYQYVGNNPANWMDPWGLQKIWYDRLSDWGNAQNANLKNNIFNNVHPSTYLIVGATLAGSLSDIGNGFLQYPSSLGHLGEGTGCFAAQPSWENASGMLMDVSLALGLVGGISTMFETTFWQYYPKGNSSYNSAYMTSGRGWYSPPYESGSEAISKLSLPPYNPATAVRRISINSKSLDGPSIVKEDFRHSGGVIEYKIKK